MDYLELFKECLPYALSIFATIVAFVRGTKTDKKKKSVAEIKAIADKKYARYVDKQCKKNKIDNVLIETNKNKETEE